MSAIADAEERRTALDPQRSFIVQAPAGSGKTGLLIQRLLRLLTRVEAPEQILAMTFTRKAAGEMKKRILDALECARGGEPPGDPHDRHTFELAREVLRQDEQLGWSLLQNPARLKIQTIDSFCAALVRQMPLLSRTGGPLDIEEKPGELYREAARRVQLRIENDSAEGDAIRTVFRHLDNSKSGFRDRILELLEKRDQWMTFFHEENEVTDATRRYLESALTGVIENVLLDARSLIPERAAVELVALAAYSGGNLAQDKPDDPLACLDGLQALPEATVSQLAQWRALANLLLTQKGEFRKTVDKRNGFPTGPKNSPETEMKNRFKDWVDSHTGNPLLLDMLDEVRKLPAPRFEEGEWQVLKATLELLPRLSATLRRVFAGRGRTDFTEIALAAIGALGEDTNPTDLLLYLDTRIQHILVDEFQDTSFKQKHLLELLTAGWERGDGRTLFIVGDPMQSIYRFRDAEVGLFLQTREHGIGDIELTSLTLRTNFRSQKKVVDWVNGCFGEIFPRRDDPDLGAISYAESQAALGEDDADGALLHILTPTEDKDARSNEEARRMVEVIREIRNDDPNQTIAILVRARSHLAAAVQHFHEEGIAFTAEDIDPLTGRPEIQDLLALLRALLSPTDRAAWLSILRAPWCGLSLADLLRLCDNDRDTSIWRLLNDPDRIATLSPDGQQRSERFRAVLDPALKALPAADFRDLLEGVWIALGGPACIGERTFSDVDVFFDEVSSALNSGGMAALAQFGRTLETLFASPAPAQDNPVQIMTMHKAKGLEFDHVLLPGLDRKPSAYSRRLVFWIPHGNDLLLAPMEDKEDTGSEIYGFLSRLDEKKNGFETLRLLYVAATRAKKQLHLFGHVRGKGNPDIDSWKPDRRSLLARLWPHIGEDWISWLLRNPNLPDEAPAVEAPVAAAHRIRRLPHPVEFPEPHPAVHAGRVSEISEKSGDEGEFVWRGSEARCLGNVLHLCLQKMAQGEMEAWSGDNLKGQAGKLRTALLAQGMAPDKIEQAVDTAMQALRKVVQDERGRWILTPHTDAHSEYPLTGFLKGRFVSVQIDRTFVDENDRRWIVDYKTGSPEKLEKHKAQLDQYKAQLNQYVELIRLKGETRPIHKALYYPLQAEFVDLT